MNDDPKVLGVVGLFIAPDGRVVAEVTDFELSGYGGFSLMEAQRIRCKRALNREVVERYAGDPLAKAISAYHAEGIIDEMVQKHGYRKHFIVIGGYRKHFIVIGHEEAES